MTGPDILQFVEVHGYNPERRDSNRWYLEVRDINNETYRGFGIHILRDSQHPNGDVLVLCHDRGNRLFRVSQVVDVAWYTIPEWSSVAQRVA